jgi:phosphoenolpyruvate-protein phosphotransferase
MSRVPIVAPIAGWLMSIRDVPDPVFSEEMMGSGVAIDPTEGAVVAPCDAEVLLVAPTKHSVTLRTESGAELLIHIGLDTVALEGRGFEAHVHDGDRVAAGDLLISFDLDAVGLEAKSLVTPIILTNGGTFQWSSEALNRLVEPGQIIGSADGVGNSNVAAAEPAQAVCRDALIRFEHGLHARPAARIADCAKRYSSEVMVAFGAKTANARSPVAIMALNARRGDRVQLSASGPEAASALEAIVVLLDADEGAQQVSVAQAPTRTLAENEIAGVCALPGTVVGTAARWRRQVGDVPEQGRGVEQEQVALREARAMVRARLRALSEQASGPAAGIAEAHIGLLDDHDLNAAAKLEMERGRSAGRAWQLATVAAADALRASDSSLVRERVADLDDICGQVIAALSGEVHAPATEYAEATVLLADELLPSELLSLRRDHIVGLATAGGGATSHMAIIAASFGIPTLVAMGPQLSRVPEGARVLLDATAGVLVIEPDEQAQARAVASAEQVGNGGECVTNDGERVRLLANLGGVGEVEAALAAGAEGCGLLRTEFLFLDRSEAPSQAEQRSAYQAIADALGGRPLTIRTLDIGGDKPVPYIRFPDEQNPALGARGVRTELFEPELFDEQLRAITDVRGDDVKVMLPMVSSVAELRAVRKRLDALREGVTLGVMVETPAAALIAERLAQEADFLSIGSNDLSQYVLAMDRTNPLLAAAIDALHPAVLRLIAMTAEAGRTAGKPVSLCGSLASEPVGALVLVGLGIRDLSGVPAALPAVRHAIGRVSGADCRALAERALTLESAAEVRALAAELLNAPSNGTAR